MSNVRTTPVLADVAGALSDQLRHHLGRLAEILAPHADELDHRFLDELKGLGYNAKQRMALAAITPGAASRILARGEPAADFFEQVEYHGRRLAKLNLPPSAIARALSRYYRLAGPIMRRLPAEDRANVPWVREQLHFCVILTLNNAYYQVREAETQAFFELFRVELESRNLDELVRRFLETLVGFCRAKRGHLYLFDEKEGVWRDRADAGCRRREPCAQVASTKRLWAGLSRPRYLTRSSRDQDLVLDPAWRGRFACWSIPIAAEGSVAGVMQFGFSKDYEWLPREQELLAAAAERCHLAVEKARLLEDLSAREAQVRQLAEHMLHVEEVERRRISRELHDEAGQSLLWVRLQLEMMEHGLPPQDSSLKPRLRDLLQQVEHTILEIRRLIAALSPAVLEQLGLGAAVRQLVSRFRRRHPCKVRLHLNRIGGLPKTTETIVYRLLQECFNNIAKHSQASTVNISLTSADGVLELNVTDDGIGFDVQEAVARRDSFGLAGMRERVTLLGGRFEVTSRGTSQPANGNSGGSGTDFKRQENREEGPLDERKNGESETVAASNGPRSRSGNRGSERSRGSGRSSNSHGTRIRIDLPIRWEG